MECPVCHHSDHVEIDIHADGFSENLQECGDCGAVWIRKCDSKEVISYHPTLDTVLHQLESTCWSARFSTRATQPAPGQI